MSMSRKNFVAIAAVISEQRTRIKTSPLDQTHALAADTMAVNIAGKMADHFLAENDNFDYHRFMEACKPDE